MLQNSQYPIGLDISDLSLKMVQLNKTRDKIYIQAFSRASLKSGVVDSGEIKNPEEFIKVIKRMIDKPIFGKFSSQEIVVCLPEPQTFIKLLKIENPQSKLDDQILSELEKYFPVPVDDMYFDFQVIENKDNKAMVLVGASPKSFVDDYIRILKDAKLFVVASEIESVAISRAILQEESLNPKNAERKNYAIIDIGESRTGIFVYSKNTILFDISISLSGDEITKKIASDLKLDYNQAELAKIIIGLDDKNSNEGIKNSISEMIEQLILKIEYVLDFDNSHFGEFGKIDKFFICGGGANIKNLDKIIEKSVNVPTFIANPLINIYDPKAQTSNKFLQKYNSSFDFLKEKSKSLSAIQNTSIDYTTAIGLALRQLFIN